MGCDIHAHLEIRCNGKWEHYSILPIDRWYELFGVMAGVRGTLPAIVPPKGVPDDMSVITKLDWEQWDTDAHTPSWFNEEEIDKLNAWLDQRQAMSDKIGDGQRYDLEHDICHGIYMFGAGFTSFKHYTDMDYIPKCCDAVRMVFWFDN